MNQEHLQGEARQSELRGFWNEARAMMDEYPKDGIIVIDIDYIRTVTVFYQNRADPSQSIEIRRIFPMEPSRYVRPGLWEQRQVPRSTEELVIDTIQKAEDPEGFPQHSYIRLKRTPRILRPAKIEVERPAVRFRGVVGSGNEMLNPVDCKLDPIDGAQLVRGTLQDIKSGKFTPPSLKARPVPPPAQP